MRPTTKSGHVRCFTSRHIALISCVAVGVAACTEPAPEKPSDAAVQQLRAFVVSEGCTASDWDLLDGMRNVLPETGRYAELEKIMVAAMFEGWFVYDDDAEEGSVYSAACNNVADNPFSITLRTLSDFDCVIKGPEGADAFGAVIERQGVTMGESDFVGEALVAADLITFDMDEEKATASPRICQPA